MFGENGQRLDLASSDASASECARGLVELATASRTVTFAGVASRPVASLLRGFSAPVRLEPAPASDDLERLLAFDDDPFNRWQAAQSLALRSIFARVDCLRGSGEAPDDRAFFDALRRLVETGDDDPAFAAQTLPCRAKRTSRAKSARMSIPTFCLWRATRCARALGGALGDRLEAAHARLGDAKPYSPDAASAGRRALRNASLDLVAAGDPAKGEALAKRQFDEATNMTDKLAALAVLALLGGDAREAAFARFYEQFADDALVIDKWFALQSTIPEEATTARVHRLMRRDDFSLLNPNRVRSLVGAFASANPTRFHALDGSGYELLDEHRARTRPEESAARRAPAHRAALLAHAGSAAPRPRRSRLAAHIGDARPLARRERHRDARARVNDVPLELSGRARRLARPESKRRCAKGFNYKGKPLTKI